MEKSILSRAKGISSIPENKLDVICGFPGSGKTTLAATYPKPMLYVQIGDDGGGIVLKSWNDEEISFILLETDTDGTIYVKLSKLIDELMESSGAGYKTLVIDAYSSIMENMEQIATSAKGKTLNWDEREAITNAMVALRDKIVKFSKLTPCRVVEITHLKSTDSTDNISGETTTRYIPKMSKANGNIMLERSNNVMYCARKACVGEDGKPEVKFLTYIGAHPNIDTKFRYKSAEISDKKGIYIENCTYDKLEQLKTGDFKPEKIEIIEPTVAEESEEIKPANPFQKENNQW